MTKQEVVKSLKILVKDKNWLNKVKDGLGWTHKGQPVEAYDVPSLFFNELEDKKLVGYLERVWEEWASEAGDYEGGVWKLIDILS